MSRYVAALWLSIALAAGCNASDDFTSGAAATASSSAGGGAAGHGGGTSSATGAGGAGGIGGSAPAPYECGACGKPRGAAIGGGEDYPFMVDPATADHVVATRAELLAALEAAKAGQSVYVDDAAEIDLSDTWDVYVPAGVTLASGRGRSGSEGALLHSDTLSLSPGGYTYHSLFRTIGPGVRFTGFRLRGPDMDIHAATKVFDSHRGISLEHDGCEIDNMELWGWSWWAAGVLSARDADVHHNSIHHNRRYGIGYGVSVSDESTVLVEGNLFDANRHSIAGNGGPGPSYEARYNMVGPTANGHAFDMHQKDGVAGDELRIHHNSFQLTYRRAVFILGVPVTGAWIEHNSLAHGPDDGGILQNVEGGPINFHVADNCFGTLEPICE